MSTNQISFEEKILQAIIDLEHYESSAEKSSIEPRRSLASSIHFTDSFLSHLLQSKLRAAYYAVGSNARLAKSISHYAKKLVDVMPDAQKFQVLNSITEKTTTLGNPDLIDPYKLPQYVMVKPLSLPLPQNNYFDYQPQSIQSLPSIDLIYQTPRDGYQPNASIVKVVLRQLYRDWTDAANPERKAAYLPIISALVRYSQKNARILVPGAGMGRLAFELVDRFPSSCVEASEVSVHLILALGWLSEASRAVDGNTHGQGVDQSDSHRVYPWEAMWSNQLNPHNQFRGFDVAADIAGRVNLKLKLHDDELSLTSLVVQSKEVAEQMYGTDYDEAFRQFGRLRFISKDFHAYKTDRWSGYFNAVTTVFFVDTAPNIREYMQIIYHVLADGGLWINNGPLLWNCYENGPPGRHEGDLDVDKDTKARNGMDIDGQMTECDGKVELSWSELLEYLNLVGFDILQENTNTTTSYVDHEKSMMRCVYRLGFFVARKNANRIL